MHRRLPLIAVSALLLSLVQSDRLLAANPTGGEECEREINLEMAREHKLIRSVVFGQKKAKDAKVGEVRYAAGGSTWYKQGSNEWRSVAKGFESTTWSDTLMDGQSLTPPRKGLLETKGVSTSEIVPYVAQSMRAFQCRLELICDTVRKSIEKDSTSAVSITATSYGCLEQNRQTIPACHLREGQGQDKTAQSDVGVYCETIALQLFDQEAAVMRMTVEYDAAYRTMLQLAGNFDLFLQEFRSPIINSLRQMVNLVGSFNRIPCFLSSCDASPPPEP